MEKSIARCFKVLEDCAAMSPRWETVFSGPAAQRALAHRLQAIALRARLQVHAGLDAARRKFEAFRTTCGVLGWDPWSPTEWQVAAFVADQEKRGADAPTRMALALKWATAAFGVNLHADSPLVSAQRRASIRVASRPVPKKAKLATPAMLRLMERMVSEAPSPLLRCWAGAHACLGQGAPRWSYLQHNKDVALTTDAVTGTTWRMKGRSVQVS